MEPKKDLGNSKDAITTDPLMQLLQMAWSPLENTPMINTKLSKPTFMPKKTHPSPVEILFYPLQRHLYLQGAHSPCGKTQITQALALSVAGLSLRDMAGNHYWGRYGVNAVEKSASSSYPHKNLVMKEQWEVAIFHDTLCGGTKDCLSNCRVTKTTHHHH